MSPPRFSVETREGPALFPLPVGVGTVSAPLALATGGCEDPGRAALGEVLSSGALKEEELVDVGVVDVVVDGDLLLFFEATTPPATPPAMAPTRRIAPMNMRILHFF